MTTGATYPDIPRTLDLAGLITRKSHLLLGPRQTGKTYLIRKSLPRARVYDLLESLTFLSMSRDPSGIEQELGRDRLVVIDESQRWPELLSPRTNSTIASTWTERCGVACSLWSPSRTIRRPTSGRIPGPTFSKRS